MFEDYAFCFNTRVILILLYVLQILLTRSNVDVVLQYYILYGD